jgi:hypothetical protein
MTKLIVFGGTLLVLAVGCTPSPKDVCAHLEKLSAAEKTSKSSKFALSNEKCIANMEEMKARDPKAYKCTAKTVTKLQNLDTAFLAISVCDVDRPKKSAKKESE